MYINLVQLRFVATAASLPCTVSSKNNEGVNTEMFVGLKTNKENEVCLLV